MPELNLVQDILSGLTLPSLRKIIALSTSIYRIFVLFVCFIALIEVGRYTNCLDETTILVDTILYLSLYYLVNDLVHLPNLHIT